MKIGTTPIVSVKSGTTPIQKVYSGVNLIWSSVDPDAQAFITAASITNPTQQTAINQLVTDLKGYGVWTKLRACYPFIGGTASSHKFNLKDPRDLDAAFRLVFNGGWTHSANGALPNGVNAWADTFLNPSVSLAQNSTHLSYYSRTNILNTGQFEIGVFPLPSGVGASCFGISSNGAPLGHFRSLVSTSTPSTSYIPTDSRGLFVASRIRSTTQKAYRNGILQATANINSNGIANLKISIGGIRLDTITVSDYTAKQTAFTSIGDGLSDTEAANFYTAVQTFQVTLGRSIGTQTVSDADAQAFVTNAGIVDQVEANAVNNLVIGLKADGLWSKMKAVYPFVGSSATSNSYNLKNTSQFQIIWNGGVTHSSTGVTFNGTNGFGDTGLNALNNLSLNSTHFSVYSRTNSSGDKRDIGAHANSEGSALILNLGGLTYYKVNSTIGNYLTAVNSNSQGNFMSNRTASNVLTGWKNGVKVATGSNASTSLLNAPIYLGALWENSNASYFSDRQYAFASLGDGLTDTEAANFYTAVQTFQTSLNRQIGTPIPLSGNLLNDYPDAKGAYSVARRLSTNYTGSLIRVRRSSDNAEQNIGYTGANVLDEAALTSFVGANDGFVTTWYDQSGNNLDIIQTTANKQPKIVNASVVIKTNGKAAMQFDGSNDELTQASLRGDTRADQYYVIQATDTQYLYPNFASTAYGFVAQDGSASSGAGNGYGTPTLYVNNTLTSTSTRNNVHDALNGQKIALHENSNTSSGWSTIAWGAYAGFEFGGLWQEYIYYNSDQSANRTGINNNINGFYTIY